MKKNILICLFLMLANPSQANDLNVFFKNSLDYENVLVKEVRSPDLIVIENKDYKKETIRLIGLKATQIQKQDRIDIERDEYGFRVNPEIDPESPVEEKALNFAIDLLDQKRVRLEFDRDKKDAEHHTLAYVFLNDNNQFVNTEILRQGYAQLQTRPPNTKYQNELRSAYQEARRNLRGFHGQ